MTRYILVDDSGSMATSDGRNQKGYRTSRWAEMCESLDVQLKLSLQLQIPTYVKFFHHNGMSGNSIVRLTQESYVHITARLSQGVNSCTPLVQNLNEILAHMNATPTNGKRSLLIYSDGCDDSANANTLNALLKHNFNRVYIAINLCTNEPDVLSYWSKAAEHMENDMDILDDYHSEAAEVQKHQPWMVYTFEMHEFRKVLQQGLYKAIDDRKLESTEIQNFIELTWNVKPDSSNPSWDECLSVYETWAADVEPVFNTVTRRMEPPIDVYYLRHGRKTHSYGKMMLVLAVLVALVLFCGGVDLAFLEQWVTMTVFPHMDLTDL